MNHKFSVLSFLYLYFMFMVLIPSLFYISGDLVSLYCVTISIFFFSLLYTLKNTKYMRLNTSISLDYHFNYLIIFVSSVFILYIFITPLSFEQVISFRALGIEKYDVRLKAISIPYYWVIEAIVKIMGALSIIFLLKNKKLNYLYCTFIYTVFYIYSVQKYPIAILLLLQLFVFFKINKISLKRFLFIFFGFLFLIIYFYALTFKEFKIDNIGVFYTAISNRVLATSDLIFFVYDEFLDNDIKLYGATLPSSFLFVYNLNAFNSEYIRLPSLIMELKTGVDYGGANTAFYTEGIVNFGVGFDIIFIMLFLFFLSALIFLSKFLPYSFSEIFKWYLSLNIINVVNVQMWGVLNVCFFVFILLLLLSYIFKLLRLNCFK